MCCGADDEISGLYNIGFTFFYGVSCVGYTQFKVSSNGWLSFNAGAVSSEPTNDLNGSTNMRPGLAPLWDDMALNFAPVACTYQTTGVTPNQVTTIQWNQVSWKIQSKSPGAISFQVKLYESSNVIEFVYHRETGRDSFPSASIGLAGATVGDYLSVNNTYTSASSSTNTQNIGSVVTKEKPAEGTIFQWTPDCLTMPIELLSFYGKPSGKSTFLYWSTATETDNDYFTVERSKDGVSFSEIKKNPGAGNSITQKSYRVSDDEAPQGLTYYRLKQTDLNGKFSYQRMISVDNKPKLEMEKIYPNPGEGKYKFDLTSPVNGKIHIVLLNIYGEIVYDEFKEVVEGRNEINITVDIIPSGTYFLKTSMEGADFSSINKLIKY